MHFRHFDQDALRENYTFDRKIITPSNAFTCFFPLSESLPSVNSKLEDALHSIFSRLPSVFPVEISHPLHHQFIPTENRIAILAGQWCPCL